MKRFINIGAWVVLTAGLVAIMGFVGQTQKVKVCSDIRIDIDRSNGNYFVEEEDINAMVYHEIDTVVGRAISQINAERLEHKINNHPSVYNTEVYKTIDGQLVIQVQQRTPIVRLFSYDGDSYYLDSTGRVMPPSDKYTSRVFVANGFIYDSFLDINQLNARKVSDSLQKRTLIDDIFTFAEYIRKDPFWKAQIEQLYVNKDFEIELIPRVGNHRIVFGDASQIGSKFKKLKIFYEKGLSKTGWNEYSVINLKYANQVVCKKRI
jgi:cell division protein FtsQ